MNKLFYFTFLFSFLMAGLSTAQEMQVLSPYQMEKDSSRFYIGLNLGGHFPNHNTAVLYSGNPAVTPYGIEYIFNFQLNQQFFNNYFKDPYFISEYPFDPRYQNTVEIGLHSGYHLSQRWNLFAELNAVQLDYEQFFTVSIDDPNNQMPGDRLERFPIIGEENRFLLNLGFQYNFFTGETSDAYCSFFGNLNDVEMQSNYIIVNNREFTIFHFVDRNPNRRPGGIGYGGGGGLGFKFEMGEKFLGDIYYNAYYIKVKMRENLQPTGLQHAVGIRLIWD